MSHIMITIKVIIPSIDPSLRWLSTNRVILHRTESWDQRRWMVGWTKIPQLPVQLGDQASPDPVVCCRMWSDLAVPLFPSQSYARPSRSLTRTKTASSAVRTWGTACAPWATCPPRWSSSNWASRSIWTVSVSPCARVDVCFCVCVSLCLYGWACLCVHVRVHVRVCWCVYLCICVCA